MLDDTRGLDYFLGKLDAFRHQYDRKNELNTVNEIARRLWDAEMMVTDMPADERPIFLLRGIARTASSLADQIERQIERYWNQRMVQEG